jgi:hypothetical protein
LETPGCSHLRKCLGHPDNGKDFGPPLIQFKSFTELNNLSSLDFLESVYNAAKEQTKTENHEKCLPTQLQETFRQTLEATLEKSHKPPKSKRIRSKIKERLLDTAIGFSLMLEVEGFPYLKL